jgi:protein-L-isoaspartate O-methyltransferase
MPTYKFLTLVKESMADGTFVKISFGNYLGQDAQLKQIFVKPIVIKKVSHYQFTYRNKTNDIVKNYLPQDALEQIAQHAENDFGVATLFTTAFESILEIVKNKKRLRTVEKKIITIPNLQHDQTKKRNITNADAPYLQMLGITDAKANVLKNAQDKYKQINHYIEILSSLLQKLDRNKPLQIADMGCGKGYLTFALYDYLTNTLQQNATVVGVENRPDLVEKCNTIAQQCALPQLAFIANNIATYDASKADVLIALHACDTATDDAIAKGIQANAQLIVVAPCCHKQIRRAMEQANVKNNLSYITKHGIMLERTAEMITDSMRALILEYYGYKTKVFEFITDVHTPKNIMITAEKGKIDPLKQKNILQQLQIAKAEFGIQSHYLETLLHLA